MSKKSQLKKEIDESEKEIAALEAKRTRSQSALITAMLSGKKPNPVDQQYFNAFTVLIDNEREHLRKLIAELESLGKPKDKKE